jgi:hypothetical protein
MLLSCNIDINQKKKIKNFIEENLIESNKNKTENELVFH